MVKPAGTYEFCCCERATLKRRLFPLVKFRFGKARLSVQYRGAVAFGPVGAWFDVVIVTSFCVSPTELPKRNVGAKTMPGVNLYFDGSRKSAGVKPLKLPPVVFPPVCGVASGLKLMLAILPAPL